MAPLALVDSHCHLNYLVQDDWQKDVASLLHNAQEVGVEKFLCISVDVEHIPEVLQIAEKFPQVKASIGIHPCSVQESPDDSLQKLETWLEHPEVLALGETGLDYFRPEGLDKVIQKKFFAAHIHMAKQTAKPLVIHTRAARQDTLEVLQYEGEGAVAGVLHCFTETIDMARTALDMGLYISFSGIITFKNAESLRDIVRFVPLDRMLIETDSPYLAPVPHRGKTNQPAYVVEVAKTVAALKDVSLPQVAKQTTQNSLDLFHWP